VAPWPAARQLVLLLAACQPAGPPASPTPAVGQELALPSAGQQRTLCESQPAIGAYFQAVSAQDSPGQTELLARGTCWWIPPGTRVRVLDRAEVRNQEGVRIQALLVRPTRGNLRARWTIDVALLSSP
jgi:hypothetical protein